MFRRDAVLLGAGACGDRVDRQRHPAGILDELVPFLELLEAQGEVFSTSAASWSLRRAFCVNPGERLVLSRAPNARVRVMRVVKDEAKKLS